MKFTGDVKECQNNFAGIGFTGNGVSGAYFKDMRIGVRAVVQHLKAYCSTKPLKNCCVDFRFSYVNRGITPYVEWLGIGENPKYPDRGWAADGDYGKSIVRMVYAAKGQKVPVDTVYKATIQTYDIMLGKNYITYRNLSEGKSYTIKTYASSPNGVLYEFWIKNVSEGNWIKIRDYKEDRFATFSVDNESIYTIKVNVKDKYSVNNVDSYVQKDFIIGDVKNKIGVAGKTIVLDAGHGGKDSGALSSRNTGYIKEADLTQKITLKLGNLLKHAGANIIYTRDRIDNYNYPSITQNLEDRINIANSINTDMFMSIYIDSASPSAHGHSAHYSSYRPYLDNSGTYESDGVTYYKTPCDAALKSKLLSQLIVNEMSSLRSNNRGIHDHNLYVTKNAKMPSVLVECGFVSNYTEVEKLINESYQNKIAQKLYNAITKLFSI